MQLCKPSVSSQAKPAPESLQLYYFVCTQGTHTAMHTGHRDTHRDMGAQTDMDTKAEELHTHIGTCMQTHQSQKMLVL